MQRLVAIYLRDHMAGSRLGIELARRLAKRNSENHYGPELAEISLEIEQDKTSLTEVMKRLDVQASRLKEGTALIGERLARLKLNGRLLGYSPLSRLVEIEALVIGVSGKLELWRSLRASIAGDGRLQGIDLDELIARAERQRERLEKLHEQAAREALASG